MPDVPPFTRRGEPLWTILNAGGGRKGETEGEGEGRGEGEGGGKGEGEGGPTPPACTQGELFFVSTWRL